MRRIIIADLKSSNACGKSIGHYFSLAKNYQSIFQSIMDVKIAGGPIYANNFSLEDILALPFDCIDGMRKWQVACRMLMNGRQLFKQTRKDDVVVIQQSMPAMILFTIFMTYWGGARLFLIQYNAEPMRRKTFRFLMYLKRKYIQGIICPNHDVGRAYGLPYIAVPDYIYSESFSKEFIPYERRIYDFCVLGRISPEKCVPELIKWLSKIGRKVVVAGSPQTEELAKEVEKACLGTSNIELHLEYLDDKVYDSYIRQSKYCILNYSEEYSMRSSGVILDMLFRGTPVIGKRCRALDFIEEQGVGYTYDNFQDINFNEVFDKKQYGYFLSNIKTYQGLHDKWKKLLIDFVAQDSIKS